MLMSIMDTNLDSSLDLDAEMKLERQNSDEYRKLLDSSLDLDAEMKLERQNSDEYRKLTLTKKYSDMLLNKLSRSQGSQNNIIEVEFKKQAKIYGQAVQKNLPLWIPKAASLVVDYGKTSKVVDICCGTGALCQAFSPHVGEVLGVDLTAEMLANAKEYCSELENVKFMREDVTKLSLASDSFDIAVTRWALHHWADPDMFVKEMTRVVKPGGSIVLVDLVTPLNICDPKAREMQDHLETVRDPSHTRIHSVEEIKTLLSKYVDVSSTSIINERELNLQVWMDQSETPKASQEKIIAIIEGELNGAVETGFRPFRKDGEIFFKHFDVLVAGVKN